MNLMEIILFAGFIAVLYVIAGKKKTEKGEREKK